jgi:hypothetical protein
MRWLELGILAEFVDRLGIIRQTAGCSLVGRFEFSERLVQLEEILNSLPAERSWVEEYGENNRFKHVVDRLLVLNGLEPDWFTPDMVSTLLFGRVDSDGNILPGWLIELNSSSEQRSGESATLAQSVAGLAESLTEAIELAQNLPAQFMIAVAEERVELYKSPEQKAEDKKRKLFNELRYDPRLEDVLSGK